MSLPWYRMYTDVMFDRKITRIARSAGLKKYEVIGIWAGLLCLANDSPVRGKLLVTLQERYSNNDVADELGIDETLLENVLSLMLDFDMIHLEDGVICITNWNKRQYSSDNSTARVRKHRQKVNDETLQKRYSNAPDTDTDTESDIESAEPPQEPTPTPKKERTQSPEMKAYYELQKRFLSISGLPEPKPKTQAEWKEFNRLWGSPGKLILGWVGGDLDKAEIVIREAVKKMTNDQLTISSFKSIEKVASDCYRTRNNGR